MIRTLARTSIGVFVVVAVTMPFLSSALSIDDVQAKIQTLLGQIQALHEQLQTLQFGSVGSSTLPVQPYVVGSDMCPHFWAGLSRGATDASSHGDVSRLQQFLLSQDFFHANISGYFGGDTETAVQQMQLSWGIVTNGTAHTTGFGVVGPRTRDLMMKWCGGSPQPKASTSPVTACTLEYAPVCGQPPEPACRHSNPACMIATQGPTTYSNTCLMKAAGATYLYGGQCENTPIPTPTCKPISYMPIACDGGVQAQATHNDQGCISGYTCPVASFTPPKNCKAWNDGCNSCSLTAPGGAPMCTERACFAAGKGYCSTYFSDATSTISTPPTISAFAGPLSLGVGEAGTWTLRASDASNESLSYSLVWGDEIALDMLKSLAYTAPTFSQATSFMHTYGKSGVYTIVITVQNARAQTSKVTATVSVHEASSPVTSCTADAKQCSDGSYVGRSGPNCEFAACPTTGAVTLPLCTRNQCLSYAAYIACNQSSCTSLLGTTCTYNGQTYSDGATQTITRPCTGNFIGIPGECSTALNICKNGQWVPQTPPTTTGTSCVDNGQTYTEGQTHCHVIPGAITGTQVCPAQNLWTCHSGQWAAQIPQTIPATCTANGGTYSEGATINVCLLAGAQTCNVGSVMMPQVKCAGGQWVAVSTQFVTNTDSSCSSVFTPGTLCGGLYLCSVSDIGARLWSHTLCGGNTIYNPTTNTGTSCSGYGGTSYTSGTLAKDVCDTVQDSSLHSACGLTLRTAPIPMLCASGQWIKPTTQNLPTLPIGYCWTYAGGSGTAMLNTVCNAGPAANAVRMTQLASVLTALEMILKSILSAVK